MDRKKIADQLIIYCFWAFMGVTALLMIFPENLLLLFFQLLFASALIGGIADWYGVISIYGRPLGISYKTEVIVSERERLVQEIRIFLIEEVLSKENIVEKLRDFQFTQKLFLLITDSSRGVRPLEEIIGTFSIVLYKTAWRLDFKKITHEIAEKIREITEEISLKEEILSTMKNTLTEKRIYEIIESTSTQALKLQEVEEIRFFVIEKVEQLLKNYAGAHKSRQLINLLFHGKISEKFMEAIDREILLFAKDPDHPLMKKWARDLHQTLLQYLEEEEFKNKIDEKWQEYLNKNTLERYIEEKIEEVLKKEISSVDQIEDRITPYISRKLLEIQEDPQKLSAIEEWIQEKISKWIDEHHEKLGDLLEENINKMSDGELVSFIKDNTEGDLQMIRLNGMAFGVLVCILVFSFKLILMWI